jgi:predicted aconitase
VPYYLGFLPRLGEHVAWSESSAIIFANSVLGARTNREGGPSALAAALTGRTPCYGFHLDEGRLATVAYRIETEIGTLSDFGALGAYVGKQLGTGTPAFCGMEHASPGIEQLVALGAALASSGSAAMFHMVGITPEAATLGQATGGRPCEERLFGKSELEAGYAQMTSGKQRKVDLVAIGCPHCSLNQIADIARLLAGRRVADGVTLWVHTNVAIKALARQLGFVDAIEQAGGLVTQDLCVVLSVPESLGFRTVATNSPKMAFYAPGGNGLPTWYGSVERCLDAAVTGAWS